MVRAVVLLAAVLALWGRAEAAPAAPGFKVRLLDGKGTVDSRELIGKKVLVLRFQASYCKVCVAESAALAELTARYRPRGVEVLALFVQDTTADVRRFVAAQKATYDVALDPKLARGTRRAR